MRLAVASAVVAMAWSASAARAQPTSEDDVKAAFLYNFAKYVEWPETALVRGELRLCVVADPAFVKSLDTIISGETIEGRPVVLSTPTTESARGCQVLFVRQGGGRTAPALLDAVKGAPVLTVGETPDFVARGGMIVLLRDGDRVRFDVDNAAAKDAGLTISSRMLRVARRVLSKDKAR